MFFTHAYDVFTDVHRFRHVHGETDDGDVFGVVIAIRFLRRRAPLRYVVFPTDAPRQRVIDVYREPISLRIDPASRVHAMFQNLSRRDHARAVKRESHRTRIAVLDALVKSFVQLSSRKRVFVQSNGEIRRQHIVADAIRRATLRMEVSHTSVNRRTDARIPFVRSFVHRRRDASLVLTRRARTGRRHVTCTGRSSNSALCATFRGDTAQMKSFLQLVHSKLFLRARALRRHRFSNRHHEHVQLSRTCDMLRD
jgi:hypothetical protein